jgi:hypothetical protein
MIIGSLLILAQYLKIKIILYFAKQDTLTISKRLL